MLMITPRAPFTDAPSSSGLEIARRAASIARSWPSATPVPIIARPIPDMIGLHVGEIEVDQARHQDQIGNPLNRLPEHVVGRRERVDERRRPIDDREQALVGNRDDRVDAVAQRFQSPLGLELPLLALELERLGDDGDRQRAELGRQAGDDRRRAGAGAAAETRW